MSAAIVALAWLLSGAQARWAGCHPDLRQRIYFANHSSHLDFIVLWAALPAEVRALTWPVAARDYWERTRWRQYLAVHVFRAVLVERGAAATGRDRGAVVEAARRTVEQTAADRHHPVGADGLRPLREPCAGAPDARHPGLRGAQREAAPLPDPRGGAARRPALRVGKLCGGHPIAPTVSPHKTVEGFVGGVASATALGTALWWMTPFRPWQATAVALVITLMGVAGG
jgi:hypothetical protein